MSATANPWITRIWSEYRAGNLTRAYRDVLLTLRTFQGHGGACWPSHETLADRAVCCVRTVQRALHQARELGLVSWVERRVRAAWRWLRTSNAYRLLTPVDPVQPGQRLVRAGAPCMDIHAASCTYVGTRPATTGQPARGVESPSKKEALQAMMHEAARAPDLLAMRRTAFAAMQAKAT